MRIIHADSPLTKRNKTMYNYKVTNPDLFAKVIDIDLTGIRSFNNGAFHGDVELHLDSTNEGKCWTGEHGANDFEANYGFIITND